MTGAREKFSEKRKSREKPVPRVLSDEVRAVSAEKIGSACAAGPIFMIGSDIGNGLHVAEHLSWSAEMQLWKTDLKLLISSAIKRFGWAGSHSTVAPIAPAETLAHSLI